MKSHERFDIDGAWWKSPQQMRSYLEGKYAYSLRPEVAWGMFAYLPVAIATYDWNPLPASGGLVATGSEEQRTTEYDRIRALELE